MLTRTKQKQVHQSINNKQEPEYLKKKKQERKSQKENTKESLKHN